MIRKKESILYCTGQIWKFRVMYIGAMIAAALVFGAQWFKGSMPGPWFVGVMLAGAVAALVALAFPVITIKCPKCGARWYWMAISKKHRTNEFRWLASQTSCPVCGTSATRLSVTEQSIGSDSIET